MSEVQAYEFQAPLSIAIDFKSPNAYLALKPSFELIDALRLEVDWLPFAAPAMKPDEPAGPDAERGARHRWIRAQYRVRELERSAALQGLNLKDLYRTPDTSLAAVGLLWLAHKSPQGVRGYLEACFSGLWDGTLDIEDETALTRVIEQAGAPAGFADFAGGNGRLEWDSLQQRLKAAGIFDVPTYVVGNELFWGRQHLPMIRKLLET